MNKAQEGFQTKDFWGFVILKDWRQFDDGRSYAVVYGKVSVYSAKELLGHDVNDRDSNWAVRIEGASQALTIAGCEVAMVAAGKPEHMDKVRVVP